MILQPTYPNYNVTILEDKDDLTQLQDFVNDLCYQAQNLEKIGPNLEVQANLRANWVILQKISLVIKNKLDSKNSKNWDDYKIVVSRDLIHNIKQAIGIIIPNFTYENIKCSKVYCLATAYWNIDTSVHYPYQVKGSGTSIINFASAMGKAFESKGEVYLESLKSSANYYENKLKFKVLDKGENHKTLMLLDADGAKRLMTFFSATT